MRAVPPLKYATANSQGYSRCERKPGRTGEQRATTRTSVTLINLCSTVCGDTRQASQGGVSSYQSFGQLLGPRLANLIGAKVARSLENEAVIVAEMQGSSGRERLSES